MSKEHIEEAEEIIVEVIKAPFKIASRLIGDLLDSIT